MATANETVLAEIDSVLEECDSVEDKYKRPMSLAGNDLPMLPASRIIGLLSATIARLSPPRSPYPSQAEAILEKRIIVSPHFARIRSLSGILQAIRADYATDRIKPFKELVHSDLFGDMLEAAEYLLGETYKDPAAVMAGGVLEQHLRELCRKHGVDSTQPNGKPKMIDTMNADLAKASAYGKIEQKQVTAWAGIRNAAAHGEYAKYDENQVRRMITGIRDFIAKYPA